MVLFKFICAVVTRALFILVALLGVWRVTMVKNEQYWTLTILFLPLVAEMIITLRRRKGQDYKWFSPPILLFLISIIPSIWLLELHHRQNKDNKPSECKKLAAYAGLATMNETLRNLTAVESIHQGLKAVCADDWILALHQILLILLIVGKWLLPLGGGVTRDELSQLLLIFVGTAADILEFTNETLTDVNNQAISSPQLVYIILAVWTWSMLQFPLHLAVVTSKPDGEAEQSVQETSLLKKHSTDIWSIVEALFIQDGPFLVVRLTVMTYFNIFHQMLGFFAIKNFLVVVLNLYRLVVICQDYRASRSSTDIGDP